MTKPLESQEEFIMGGGQLRWAAHPSLFLRPELRGITKCSIGLLPPTATHPPHLYVYSNLSHYAAGDPTDSLREWGESIAPVMWPLPQDLCIFTRRKTNRVKMMYLKFTKTLLKEEIYGVIGPKRYTSTIRFLDPHFELWVPLHGHQ